MTLGNVPYIVALICGKAKIIVHLALIRMNNSLRTVLGLNQVRLYE